MVLNCRNQNLNPMKKLFFILLIMSFLCGCSQKINKEEIKKEIQTAEKAFEKLCAEKGIEEGFYFYAESEAVIKRQNDTLIKGKENIKKYYQTPYFKSASVTWNPDFIEVSEAGDMAYTYGKYIWKSPNAEGKIIEARGVFHTVWRRQKDGSWRYVWD